MMRLKSVEDILPSGLYSLEQILLQKGYERKRLQGVEEDTRRARQGRVWRVTLRQNDARDEGRDDGGRLVGIVAWEDKYHRCTPVVLE